MKPTEEIELKEMYKQIGIEVQNLRVNRAKLGIADYSDEIGLSRIVYRKIEKGAGDYYVSSLKRAISYYPDMTLEKLFKEAGL